MRRCGRALTSKKSQYHIERLSETRGQIRELNTCNNLTSHAQSSHIEHGPSVAKQVAAVVCVPRLALADAARGRMVMCDFVAELRLGLPSRLQV